MIKKDKPSLHNILMILFILVSIIPILILGVSYYSHQNAAFRKRTGQELLLLARGLSSQIELYLSTHTRALETLSLNLSPLSISNTEAQNRLLANTRKNFSGFRHLYVLNPEGIIVASDPLISIEGSSFLGMVYSDREYYKNMLKKPEVIYTEAFKGRISGRTVLVVAVPVTDAKTTLKSILVGSLDLQKIKELTESIKIGAGIYAVLVDPKGAIISHPSVELRDSITNLSGEEVARRALEKETGILQYNSFDGDKRIGGYTFVKPVNWGVWVSQSLKEQQRDLRDIAVVTLLLVCACLIADIVMAFFLSQKLSEPLQKLVASAKNIGEGIFEQSFEWKKKVIYGEVRTLADTIDQMASMLKSRDEEIKAYSTGLEEKVAERTRELSEAHEELLTMHSQLIRSEKLSAVGQLAAGIAHELNNPLAAILTNIQSFPEPSQEEKVKKRLQMLERAVERCKAIIENLLNYSRQGKNEKDQEIDLNKVIGETLEFLKYGIGKDNVELLWLPGEVLPVNGNYGEISQVVTNLVFNAKDAVRDNPEEERRTISIKTYKSEIYDQPYSLIEVSDKGTGIPQEKLGKIWDPFYTTKDIGKGTGLGLWICYQIVKKHNGEIEVESEPGKGSTFRIRFPGIPPDSGH